MSQNREITFYKMQGAGNDFIVFDNRDYGFLLHEIISFTPRLCHRRFGAGADGVLVLDDAVGKAGYRMVYRNADGSDAGMCGNGARCIARFAVKKGFPEKHTFLVHDRTYSAEVNGENVTIDFPVEPVPKDLPEMHGSEAVFVHSGTEHVVTWVDEPLLDNKPELTSRGREIRQNRKLFPTGTNVNFISPIGNDGQLRMMTYERGVEDLTLACGTGALACSVAYHHKFKQGTPGHFNFDVICEGGPLQTSFNYNAESNSYHSLKLTGPAVFVFEGTYFI